MTLEQAINNLEIFIINQTRFNNMNEAIAANESIRIIKSLISEQKTEVNKPKEQKIEDDEIN